MPRLMVICGLCLCVTAVRADSLGELSERFWQWRAAEQPFSADDIPRLERPPGVRSDWSAGAMAARMHSLEAFERRWRAIAPSGGATLRDRVDYRLLGSAIARVRWELAISQGWRRNPQFYVDQTVGAFYEQLLPPPPFSAARQSSIIAIVSGIPDALATARENLTDLRGPFAQIAVDSLDRIEQRLPEAIDALRGEFDATHFKALRDAVPRSVAALSDYRAWIQSAARHARRDTAVGRDAYLYFLRNVALLPYSPQEMLLISRQEWSRSVALEAYHERRLASVPPAQIFPDVGVQAEAERRSEEQIRAFLVDQGILTVPAWMQHYLNRPLPKYLEPIADAGEADDFTGPSRLDQPATRYIPDPRPGLGFFSLSSARDPRPIVVHEGVPGHYFQLCLGWRNPDPVRRHYYDSGANEGIGFYAEEMLLEAGLFDDNPRTRATIYSFMRLRALRVEADVKLALGEFTLEDAANYLERTVPMDKATALAEAALFASTPGQAISYQIGKSQIVRLLADVRRAQGPEFSLLRFHDFLWANGNVPLSLQRWELLGDESEVPAPTRSRRR